ncbi:DUF2891 domain-containing protein [Streptomyces sp. ODS28]|uniref:DUF2891 domain-containing protein n=1 Tax=Streptomyces sp. ODS28 TaxID=3136688 RepID=UPI0031F0BD9F
MSARSAELAAHAPGFARVALANITREYPNFPAHLIASDAELVPPREHHPAFYGAYDWHSSVHMHWLLVRLLRRHGEALGTAATAEITEVLDTHLAPDALAAESRYLTAHPSFERPYGWAWLLQLTAEARRYGSDPWHTALAPAARAVSSLLSAWLPKATYPVRHGTHANSAFALALVLDSAEEAGVPELREPVTAKLRAWYADDSAGSFRWEPSGQDFLSPLLCEADVMRRVLEPEEYAGWLTALLPELTGADGSFLPVPHISDPTDPQIGHLLGLCLSRAYALRGIAGSLPAGDPRTGPLNEAADTHLTKALPATESGDFTTDHWLATFATLALEAG